MVMQHKGTLGNQRIPACIVMWPSWCNLEHGDRSIDRVLNRCLWVPSVTTLSVIKIQEMFNFCLSWLNRRQETATNYGCLASTHQLSSVEQCPSRKWLQVMLGNKHYQEVDSEMLKWVLGGEGGKILTLTCSPPPTWACISLQQNHTNTHRSTSLCTGFKNISSIPRGQIALLPTISLLHSQLSQAAHYTHNLNTETVCCKVF